MIRLQHRVVLLVRAWATDRRVAEP
jgi:hypothetical protein